MERQKHIPPEAAIPTPIEVDFARIPEQLQAINQWVVWRYEVFSSDGEQDIKKPPFNPRTATRASVAKPETWGSFAQAKHAYKTGKWGGVGFILTGGIVGIDIDHCVTKEGIKSEAQEIITTLRTYADYSPSHTGVHLLLSGSLPGPYRRKGNVEMYQDGRYLTITGQAVEQVPLTLTANQEQLAAVYRYIFTASSEQTAQENTGWGSASHQQDRHYFAPASDKTVLQKAYHAKNGANFKRYYEGDYSLWEGENARHRSQSEADFTLVLLLLYWTNNDTAQVDRLFRQSGLMRAKWERPTKGAETYGEHIIADALKKGHQ